VTNRQGERPIPLPSMPQFDGPPGRSRYHRRTIRAMAMTLRLTDEQTLALRARAAKEGRSMQQIARAALDEYLLRAEDDELTGRLAEQGAQRYAELLRRLGAE
jgi:plasmid stability protein